MIFHAEARSSEGRTRRRSEVGFAGNKKGVYPIDISRLRCQICVMPARSTLFKSNRSQAVRLPKELAFPDGVKQVAIRKLGKARVIAPADSAWDDFFDSPGVDLGKREQPEADKREPF